MKNIKKKSQKLFCFLIASNIYCLILGWFSGENKLNYLSSYFFHFLTWWCVWNSLLTIIFAFWKSKYPNNNTYFSQVFSLITMISNLISMGFYGTSLIIWVITSLTTYLGITSEIKKFVPIPNHNIREIETGKQLVQVFRVIRWWFYSPLWHLISPTYFIAWFFRHERMTLLKKRMKATILSSLIMPTFYFLYCLARSKLGDKTYFKDFRARWPYFFLSSRFMSGKLPISRSTWKIISVLFWFSLFSLITYFSIKFRVRIKKFFVNKKQRKKQHISFIFHNTN